MTARAEPRDGTAADDGSVAGVVVAVPARDEEALLPACLDAIARAVAEVTPGIRTAVVVGADRCTDGTVALARSRDGVIVDADDHGGVGRARTAAVDAGLRALALPPASVWIANTDADTVVPPHWIAGQLRHAAAGAVLTVGTVRPTMDDLTPAQRCAWIAGHPAGVANGHVHGANLGVRADAYLAVGGFGAGTLHEDVDLVRRLTASGRPALAVADIEVLTSGRRDNRVDGGYAGFLHEQLGRGA